MLSSRAQRIARVGSGRTQMAAVALAGDDRLAELARMMGGDASAEAGKKLAKQLMAAGKGR